MAQGSEATNRGYEEKWFATKDGLRLEYRDYEANAPSQITPIICLHGLTRNLRDFEDVSPRMAALGFRVLVPSQRGRGASAYDPDTKNYDPEQYAVDMIGLLKDLNIESAIFVGSSMGGIMTMIISQSHPDLVAGAILNDIGIELDPVGIQRIMGYVGKPALFASWEEAAKSCREGNGHAFPLETSDEFWHRFARRVCHRLASGEISYAYDIGIAAPTQNAHSGVPNYANEFETLTDKPVLLMRGQTSDLLSRETVQKMKYIHPDLSVFEVPNIGHVPFLSEVEAWQRVSEYLEEFKSEGRGHE